MPMLTRGAGKLEEDMATFHQKYFKDARVQGYGIKRQTSNDELRIWDLFAIS